MPTKQTKRKELWGRWSAALSARDLRRAEEVAEEICDQDCVVHSSRFPDFGRGPAGAKEFARHVIADCCHIRLTVEDFVGEGDKTAVRTPVRITVAATGQRLSYPLLNIIRWVVDKIAERWELTGPPAEQA